MSNIDEEYKEFKRQEREQNKILQDIPEWQEYKRESRTNGKKAKHNKEFFKKSSNSEAKRKYKTNSRLNVIAPVAEPKEHSMWQKLINWLRY